MAKEKKQLKLLSKEALRKKYAGSGTASIIIPASEDVLKLPSRILALNAFLGGGLFYGKICVISGPESTGKTLVASDFVVSAQSLGGVGIWADVENSWSNDWAEKNGIDTDRIEILPNPAIETISDWVRDACLYYRAQLTNNEPIVFVFDSIAMSEKIATLEVDSEDTKSEMGGRSKAIGDFLRKRAPFFYKYGICVILINQLRDKVGAGMFESNETMPAINPLKFSASQWFALSRGKQIKEKIRGKERRIGQNIYIQHRKNKVGPPQENIPTQVYFRPDNSFGYIGFNKYMGLPDILMEQGIIKKKGSRYYRKDKMIANGEDNLVKVLHENDKLRSLLISKSDINTIGKTRRKLDSIKENLYKVKIKAQDE